MCMSDCFSHSNSVTMTKKDKCRGKKHKFYGTQQCYNKHMLFKHLMVTRNYLVG